jgi:hypothetical protein
MSNPGDGQSKSWSTWTEEDIKASLRSCGISDTAIDHLIQEGWNQGDLLTYLSPQDLKDAGLKAGHIAAVKRMYRNQGIPNSELNPNVEASTEPGSKSANPASFPGSPRPGAGKQSKLALAMKASASPLSTPPGLPSVFKMLTRTTAEDSQKKIRAVEIGTREFCEMKPSKHVLVVGATGCGKTTWINGLANFLYSVQWTDDFRFKVVTEEDETGAVSPNRQAHAQTDFVTC